MNEMYGYKVMNFNPSSGTVISGADSRVTKGVKLQMGMMMRMPGRGIFMSNNRDFVIQYYDGMHDYEAIIKFKFDSRKITSGNLTDREAEFTVRQAKVIDFDIQVNL